MKKVLLLSLLSILIISSCKKKDHNVSTVVTASFPTIVLGNGQFFSITVGALRPTIVASAYDSFYKQSCSILVVDSTVNNLVPGLYTGNIQAKNQYGFVSSMTYYVAVTNITDTMNLTGYYLQALYMDSTSTAVQKLSRGLYSTSNVLGVNMYTSASNVINAYFAVIDDTTIAFDPITVNAGVVASPGTLSLATGDTTLSYTTEAGPVSFFKH